MHELARAAACAECIYHLQTIHTTQQHHWFGTIMPMPAPSFYGMPPLVYLNAIPPPKQTTFTQSPDGCQHQSLEADLVAAAAVSPAPAPEVTAALEAAGLVVAGRAVVGPLFTTGDAAVLAAGPVAKFSR